MFRRRPAVSHRGPGLARTVARTAVISGTATATSGAVASLQARRQQAAQEAADLEQQLEHLQAREVQRDMANAPSAPAQVELAARIAQLGELHAKGLLTAEEFAAAKAKLLGI